MKYNKILALFLGVFTTVSCSQNDEPNIPQGASEIGVTVQPYIGEGLDGDDDSRSTLLLGSSGMDFAWEDDERVTVFAEESDLSSNRYRLVERINANYAKFKADGFQLSHGKRYFTLSKIEGGSYPGVAPDGCSIPDKRNITLTYKNQRQTKNYNGKAVDAGNETASRDIPTCCGHLGAYDYMAATGVCVNSAIEFHYIHLGATLRVIFQNLPYNRRFRTMQIYDSENTYHTPVRVIDLTNGVSDDGLTYEPAYNPIDQDNKGERFELNLGEDTNNNGVTSDDYGFLVSNEGGTEKGRIQAFIEVPPVDLTGKKLVFVLLPADGGSPYYMEFDGKPIRNGYVYQFKDDAKAVTNYNVTLKVNYNWQRGADVDETRAATGDPGFDDNMTPPSYIYSFFCVGEKLKAYTKIHVDGKNDTNPSVLEENDKWSDPLKSEGNTIISYQTPFQFSLEKGVDYVDDSDLETLEKNVYFIASNTDISSQISVTEGTTTEEQVRALAYSMPLQPVSPETNLTENITDFKSLPTNQAFMRDLYSTPLVDVASFIGKLTDPVQDITLYHVAA